MARSSSGVNPVTRATLRDARCGSLTCRVRRRRCTHASRHGAETQRVTRLRCLLAVAVNVGPRAIGRRFAMLSSALVALVTSCSAQLSSPGSPGPTVRFTSPVLSMAATWATPGAEPPASGAVKPLPKWVDAGPHAASFISADEGWALIQGDCRMCSRLMHTTTGGRRWTVLARPALPGPGVALDEGLIDMFFVDAHTGYVFAADECRIGCVIVTHDGGRSWQASTVPPLLQVLAGARFVYGLANSSPRPTVLRATIGTDRWTTVPIPTRALPPRTEPGARPLPFIAVEGDTIAVLRRSPAGTSPR